jgi:uncharacterized protein (TIGR02246 family)
MNSMKRLTIVLLGLSALAGCAKPAPPAPDTKAEPAAATAVDTAADEAAIRAINPAWFTAYNARNPDGIAALYADDAVLNIPGLPPVRGQAAIREAVGKDVEASAAAGLIFNGGSAPEFGVSGDLGWEWNTFTITDASGATVDSGKYVTVYGRRDGKWLIIRDIWNSDVPPAAAAPAQ